MTTSYGFQATMTAKPGRGDELVQLLLGGPVDGPAAHEACTVFLVSRSTSRPDVVHLIEGWTSEAAHAEVFDSPLAQAYIARFDELVDESSYDDQIVVGGKADLVPADLGGHEKALGEDHRLDPRLLAAVTPLGIATAPPPAPVGTRSALEDVLGFVAGNEAGFGAIVESLTTGLPAIDGVEREERTIAGADGHDIVLHLHRPVGQNGPLPAIVHLHGGAMTMFEASWPNFRRWRDALATRQLVVVGVEFRNAAGRRGPHPFPAGLDDCTDAVRWVDRNRAELGVSGIVLSGESGGGNLAIATALRAGRDGDLGDICGVYSQCPYISGAYAAPPPTLPSLSENNGYLLSCRAMSALAAAYDPGRRHAHDPLAWPHQATPSDLAGLPPHVISVNELDPLRDEGLAFAATLERAGVDVRIRMVPGTFHAADCLFEAAIPDLWNASLDDIADFARSVVTARR